MAKAFTIVEIMLVVVIIAFCAMLVVPMASSAASMQLRSAADVVASDLEYAKSLAITRCSRYSVEFDKNLEKYQITDVNGTVISHPMKAGFDYVVEFGAGHELDRVEIVDVDFDPDSGSIITFDYLGSPYSGSNPLNNGTIQLGGGGSTVTISVEPVTAYITIFN